jgi:hypothetical protein
LVSPLWLAVTLQLPAPVIVNRAPATVQVPLALKLTGSPDVAVAVRLKGGSP